MHKTILQLLRDIERPDFVSDVFAQDVKDFAQQNNIDELYQGTTLLGHAIAFSNVNAIESILSNASDPNLSIVIDRNLDINSKKTLKTTPLVSLINNPSTHDIDQLVQVARIIKALYDHGADLGGIKGKYPISEMVDYNLKKILVFNGITYKTGNDSIDAEFVKKLCKDLKVNHLDWFKIQSLHADAKEALESAGLAIEELQENAYQAMLRTGECPRTLLGLRSQNLENALSKIFEELNDHPEKFFTISWSKDIIFLLSNNKALDIERLEQKAYDMMKKGCDTKVFGSGYTSSTVSWIGELYKEMQQDAKLYLTIHENTLAHIKEKEGDLSLIKANARKELESNFGAFDPTSCNVQTTELLKEIALSIQKNPMSFLNMQLSLQSLDAINIFIAQTKSSNMQTIQSVYDFINQQLKNGAELILSESGDLTPNQQIAIDKIAEELETSYHDDDKKHSKLWLKIKLSDNVKKFIELKLQETGLSLEEIVDDAALSMENGSIIPTGTNLPENTAILLEALKSKMLSDVEFYLQRPINYLVLEALKFSYKADIKTIHQNALTWLKSGNFPQDVGQDISDNLRSAINDISKEITKTNSRVFLDIELHRESYKLIAPAIIEAVKTQSVNLLKAKISPLADGSTKITKNAMEILSMLAHDLIDNPSNYLKSQLHESAIKYLSSSEFLSQIKKDYNVSDKLGEISKYSSCLDYIKAEALACLENGAELDKRSNIAKEILLRLQAELKVNPEKIMYFNLHQKTQEMLNAEITGFCDAIKMQALSRAQSGCDLSQNDTLNYFGQEVLNSLVSGILISGVDTVRKCSLKTHKLILNKLSKQQNIGHLTESLERFISLGESLSDHETISSKPLTTSKTESKPVAVSEGAKSGGILDGLWSFVGLGSSPVTSALTPPQDRAVSSEPKDVNNIEAQDAGLKWLNFMASIWGKNIEIFDSYQHRNSDDAVPTKAQDIDVYEGRIIFSAERVELEEEVEATGCSSEFVEVE